MRPLLPTSRWRRTPLNCHALWALACIALGWATQSLALSPDVKVRQLYRTSWTVRNGAPSGVTILAQTTDGALWIGASGGLFRFDGVQFEHVTGTAHASLLSADIRALWAPPTGGLWIGYRVGGASFLKNGVLDNYAAAQGLADGSVTKFVQDTDGVIWAATTSGLKQLAGSRWVDKGTELGAPEHLFDFAADRSGTLWSCGTRVVMYLPHGGSHFESTTLACGDDNNFAPSSQSDVWLAGHPLINLTAWLSTPVEKQRRNNTSTFRLFGPFAIDNENGFWFGRDDRIFHSSELPSDDLPESDRLLIEENGQGRPANCILIDRENDVWIGTADGIVMLREQRLIIVPRNTSGDARSSETIITGDQGSIWIAGQVGDYPTTRTQMYRTDTGSTVAAAYVFPEPVRCGYRDPAGVIWLGGTTQLWRSNGDGWTAVQGPRDIPTANNLGFQILTTDHQGAIWLSVVRAGVFRLESGIWTRFESKVVPGTEAATSLATDTRGRIWIGYTHDRVLTVDGQVNAQGTSTIHSLTAKDGLQLGNILTITADGENVWVGGEKGLARVTDSRVSPMLSDVTEFHSVSGIVKARNGDLWLNSNDGLIHLRAAEVMRFVEDPNYRVQPEILNYLDGMPGVPSGLRIHPNIVEASDGRIWVSTTNGVAWTDPEHFHRNSLKPNVEIREVIADGKRMEGRASVTFPKKTRNIQINYTAYSLTIPERVKFRYRLRGLDSDWQDPGTRRTAFYTDVPPGRYRFEVIASNNDGVWNNDGAASEFDIQPMFYQTKAFLILCIMAAATLIWLGVVTRLRQVQLRMRSSFELRMAERTRIARDLHDTLLQTIQGSKLFVDQAIAAADNPTRLRATVEHLSEWLNRAIIEGRAALNSLRAPWMAGTATSDARQDDVAMFSYPDSDIDATSPADGTELEQSFQQLGEQFAREYPTSYSVSVTGNHRNLNPRIVPEIHRIGFEAVNNAFRHAKARTIRVEIFYSRLRFTLRVIDDGHGFDPGNPEELDSGHWGLKGMKERAANIYGQLKIDGAVGGGTIVELALPAWRAYAGLSRLGA